MKSLLLVIGLGIASLSAGGQQVAKNVIVVTIDGIRWQEIFKGADAALLFNPNVVQDTQIMKQMYWHPETAERRKLLMPFFWSVLQQNGQLLGNRQYQNEVDVSNFYRISYAGYGEMFTGKNDRFFIPNLAIKNKRTNIFQYLDAMDDYQGQVAAFCSWRVLPYILNEPGGNVPVNGGYEMLGNNNNHWSNLIDSLQAEVVEPTSTRHDLLTFESAKNYMEQKQPRVLYLALGEADVAAHHGQYDQYLQKLHQADAMLAELWYYVQTNEAYKDQTAMLITTDHGRGRKPKKWTTHGFWAGGSGETWMALLGTGIAPLGEVKQKQQVYQKQVAPTIASLLGETFAPGHRVPQPIDVQQQTR